MLKGADGDEVSLRNRWVVCMSNEGTKGESVEREVVVLTDEDGDGARDEAVDEADEFSSPL